MDSEFRLCPVCRAPNTVQDAVCAACGAHLPVVSKAPSPAFDTIPGRQEARRAARSGIGRGLLVGIASAAVLGLLVARTFRTPSLEAVPAPAAAAPANTPQPQAVPLAPAVPVAPVGLALPNPYSSPGSSASAYPGEAAAGAPSPSPSYAPAMIIAAPEAPSRPVTTAAGTAGPDAKPASYTDADLARIRGEAEAGAAPAGEDRAVAASPSPRRSVGEEREARLRERRDAVRAAQKRVDEAQTSVDDIRREARENDDDGLQEELKDALSELKDAQRDLAKTQRKLRELEDRSVLPPQ